MNTNILEICEIRCLEWRCFVMKQQENEISKQSPNEDEMVKTFEQLCNNGYLCSLTSKKSIKLWIFDLNKRDCMPTQPGATVEFSRGIWEPKNYSKEKSLDAIIPPSDSDALPAFRLALERLFDRVLRQCGFSEKNGCYLPIPSDDRHFYRPLSGINSDIATGVQPSLTISFDYFIDGCSLCVNVIVRRQESIANNPMKDTMALVDFRMDAIRWIQRAYLGLDALMQSKNCPSLASLDPIPSDSSWCFPQYYSDVWYLEDTLPAVLAPSISRSMISSSPMYEEPLSLNFLNNGAPRKQPPKEGRVIEDLDSGESDGYIMKAEQEISPSNSKLENENVNGLSEDRIKEMVEIVHWSDRSKEEREAEIIFENAVKITLSKKRKLGQNSNELYFQKLKNQVEMELKIPGEDPNRHKTERLLCPSSFQVKKHDEEDENVEDNAKTWTSLWKRMRKPTHSLMLDYQEKYRHPRFQRWHHNYRPTRHKCKKKQDMPSNKLIEKHLERLRQISANAITSPGQSSSTSNASLAAEDSKVDSYGKDSSGMGLEGMLSIEEVEWAAFLLQQEALVPWRHCNDRWIAIGKSQTGETASEGERIVTLNKILPVLLRIRQWLNRVSEKEMEQNQSSQNSSRSKSKPNQLSWTPLNQWRSNGNNSHSDGKIDKDLVFQSPSFLVTFGEEWLKIQPESVSSWETAQLRPSIESKDVNYVILCPSTEDQWIGELAKNFINNVSAMYQDCGLGDHAPMSDLEGIFSEFSSIRDSFSLSDSKDMIFLSKTKAYQELNFHEMSEFQVLEAIRTCVEPYERIGQFLYPLLKSGPKPKSAFADPPVATVLYVVSPFPKLDCLHRCHLLAALGKGLWKEYEKLSNLPFNTCSIVVEIIQMDQLLQVRSLAPTLRELCFAIFNKTKCKKKLEKRNSNTKSTTKKSDGSSSMSKYIYEPLYMLPPPETSTNQITASVDLSQYAVHGSYTWSNDHQWLIASWTDTQGSVLEVDTYCVGKNNNFSDKSKEEKVKFLQDHFVSIWNKGMEVVCLLGKESQVILTKIGTIENEESKAWELIFERAKEEKACLKSNSNEEMENLPPLVNSISLLGMLGNSSLQLLPSWKNSITTFASSSNELEMASSWDVSYGCIAHTPRFSMDQQGPTMLHAPMGYLIMRPSSPHGTPPSALGGAVMEDVAAEHTAEVALEVSLEFQFYKANQQTAKDSSSPILTWEKRIHGKWLEEFLYTILKQFHDLSWLTFHPISLQRHSPFPIHLASTDSICNSLSFLKQMRSSTSEE